MAKLKAKDGIRGVSVGGSEYAVDKKGYINVPDEFVPAVLDAGFVQAEGDADDTPVPAAAPVQPSDAPAQE